MSTILFFILALFTQAIALKLALAVIGQTSADNKFSTALTVAAMLNIAMVITALIPFVGWIAKPLVWMLIIMSVYKTSFFKTVGVAGLQYVIQAVLTWLLKQIGFSEITTIPGV